MCLSWRAASERSACYKFGASQCPLSEWACPVLISPHHKLHLPVNFSQLLLRDWCSSLILQTSVFSYLLVDGFIAHWSWNLSSFFFFSCECMCTPICKLMWAYCSLHSGSAWGLGATWEWYVAWSNTHCFAARLTTKRLMGCCHSRMASGQLVQNKLISACKRLCIL